MIFPHSEGDLYHKYRPHKFKEIVGHTSIVQSIKKAVNSPSPARAYILSGDSGTGKTTTARIISLLVNCERVVDGEPCLECSSCTLILAKRATEIVEMNAAETRGIDDIRHLSSTSFIMPLQLRHKVYILDECHQLSKDAQNALLKILEEAPNHVFVVLCTTDPSKLLPAVRNRCQQFLFRSLSVSDITKLINEVATYEAYDEAKLALAAPLIAEHARGCPRTALVALQQVFQLDDITADTIRMVLAVEGGMPASLFQLINALGRQGNNWSEIAAAYEATKELGCEQVWMGIAGYYRNKLLAEPGDRDSNCMKYARILDYFSRPFTNLIKPENTLVYNLFAAMMIRNNISGW
jgi:DNA polymerase III subunit gamma/tau